MAQILHRSSEKLVMNTNISCGVIKPWLHVMASDSAFECSSQHMMTSVLQSSTLQ